MTFEERVTALEPLGFTPRQTRFLVTAALHSGYCLRRQYLAFAGVRYGKNVRDFLEGVVRRGLARRFMYQPNRGQVYHLHATSLYRAIGQRDNRNRRHASPALIARRLMLLDCVLMAPDAEWFATEEDKVALFTREYGLTSGDLPRRLYAPSQPGPWTTARYFTDKLPIYRPGDRAAVHFVYVTLDKSGAGLEQFLHGHVRLLSVLPEWCIVAAYPGGLRGAEPVWQAAFDRFFAAVWQHAAPENVTELRWFLATRQLVETGDLRSLSVPELDRYREARRRLASPQIEVLYRAWLTNGEQMLTGTNGVARTTSAPLGCFKLHELPSRYTQFGPLPGVC